MKELTLEEYEERIRDPKDYVLDIAVYMPNSTDVDYVKIKLDLIFPELNEKYIFTPTPIKCPSIDAANAMKAAIDENMIRSMVESMNKGIRELRNKL